MRAYEFITESNNSQGLDLASYSLPATYVIPELQNQDFYEIYRFGLAIADVRGSSTDDNVQNKYRGEFKPKSDWGEQQVISSIEDNIGDIVDKALRKVGKKSKKLVSTMKSEEIPSTTAVSPIKPFKGYKR